MCDVDDVDAVHAVDAVNTVDAVVVKRNIADQTQLVMAAPLIIPVVTESCTRPDSGTYSESYPSPSRFASDRMNVPRCIAPVQSATAHVLVMRR